MLATPNHPKLDYSSTEATMEHGIVPHLKQTPFHIEREAQGSSALSRSLDLDSAGGVLDDWAELFFTPGVDMYL